MPSPWPRLGAAAIVLAAVLRLFPLFHAVPLVAPAAAAGAMDVAAFAERVWREQLPAARAMDATVVAVALRNDPKAAIKTYAHLVGLGGTAYFFVSGEGRVVARDRDTVRLVLGEGTAAPVVEIQIGAIFGNTVRDGIGLLDVNQLPSLQDFNMLASELNQRVESRVLPVLRTRAQAGARVAFTGCAEAVGLAPDRALLSIIPIRAEVR